MHQRDGVTGEQPNFTDSILADKQYKQRQANHEPSSRSQAPKGKSAIPANVGIGDLIFLRCDGDKHLARDKYIVTATEKDRLFAKKLAGSQFRSKTYELKYTEVFPAHVKHPMTVVGSYPHVKEDPYASDDSSSSEESDLLLPLSSNLPLDMPYDPGSDLTLLPLLCLTMIQRKNIGLSSRPVFLLLTRLYTLGDLEDNPLT